MSICKKTTNVSSMNDCQCICEVFTFSSYTHYDDSLLKAETCRPIYPTKQCSTDVAVVLF